MENIQLPSVSVIAAAPRSGKTWLIKHFILHRCLSGAFNHGIVFCPTYGLNDSYDWMPSDYVHTIYNDEILLKFLSIQARAVRTEAVHASSFIVFDDCISMINFNSKVINHLFTCFRHYNISLIFSTQYIYKCPPLIRNCCENFVIFKQGNMRSINALRECCMAELKNNQECQQLIDSKCVNKHYLLVKPLEDEKKKYTIARAPAKLARIQLSF